MWAACPGSLLHHNQSVVVQVELPQPGEALEHTRANRCKLVIAQVHLLHVVQMLKARDI